MKKRRWLFAFLAALIVSLLVWWHWGATTAHTSRGPKSAKASSIRIESLAKAQARWQDAILKTPGAGNIILAAITHSGSRFDPIPYAQLAAAGISKGDIINGIQDAENQKPLDVYGKVIDQHGDPVAGAKVQGNAVLNDGPERTKDDIHYTQTDANGLFSFSGLHGIGLGIWPQKDGYEYNLKLPSRRPENYTPDPNKPVIFTMWKLQGAEPMVHSKIHDYIPCDGTEIHYDLLTGKRLNEGGDFVVTLIRNPVDIVRGKRFDWQISLSTPSGGIIQIHDLYPYQAPEFGYTPSVLSAHKAGDKDWSVDFDANYYVKARDGQIYARIHVSVNVNYQPPPTAFDVDIYANPEGSRDLEFDPKKALKPAQLPSVSARP